MRISGDYSYVFVSLIVLSFGFFSCENDSIDSNSTTLDMEYEEPDGPGPEPCPWPYQVDFEYSATAGEEECIISDVVEFGTNGYLVKIPKNSGGTLVNHSIWVSYAGWWGDPEDFDYSWTLEDSTGVLQTSSDVRFDFVTESLFPQTEENLTIKVTMNDRQICGAKFKGLLFVIETLGHGR